MGQPLTCQWCGCSGSPEEFDLDTVTGEGFWCPDCDGYSYFDKERNHLRRILLILEDKSQPETTTCASSVRKLRKHLSPLRYPGGKSKLIDYLSMQFQKSHMDTFVEVFAGGASVGLALLDAGLIQHLVLNDVDEGVYSFWKQVVDDPSYIIRYLDHSIPNHATFRLAKEMLDEPKYWSQEQLALAQLIVNRLSFSGISKANAMGGKDGDEKQLLSRWNPKTLKNRIERIYQLSNSIEVTNINAVELIEHSAYWNEHSTLFIDPPYVIKGKALYRKYYDEDDHRQLAWLIQSLYQGIPGADIVITYDDCDLIREIYPLAQTIVIGRDYSI